MKLSVRDASFPADRRAVFRLLSSEFEDWGDEAKLDWLYLENPLGPARLWALEDGAGALAGVSAAFPRELQVGDRVLRAWVLGDFCVAREHRSLGPALALQRAACDAVESGEVDVWYDFPSKSMLAVYRRLGLSRGGELVRFVRPLRVDGVVEKKLEGAVGKGVSRVGNVLLASRDALQKRDADVEVSPYDGDFEEELSRELVTKDAVSVRHSAGYLIWRYRLDPRGHMAVYAARRGGVWAGAIAVRWSADSATISDVIGVCDDGVLRELVLEALGIARERGLERLNVFLSEGHSLTALFESLGFHRREGGRFIVHARAGILEEGFHWNLMDGDRDL